MRKYYICRVLWNPNADVISMCASIRAMLLSADTTTTTTTPEQHKMHTLKLMRIDGHHLHHLLDGVQTTNNALQTLHFAHTDIDNFFAIMFTSAVQPANQCLLYQLPRVFTNIRDVQVAYCRPKSLAGIEGAKQLIQCWLLHWQRLQFPDMRAGLLYVRSVDLGANLHALGVHMNEVLQEHAYNVHLQQQHEDGRHNIHYIYTNTSGDVRGTFTLQYY